MFSQIISSLNLNHKHPIHQMDTTNQPNNSLLNNPLFLFTKVSQGIAQVIEEDRKRLDETYDFPAQIGLANLHKKAIRFGYNPKIRGSKKKMICSCCEENVQTVKLSITDEETSIYQKEKKFRLPSSVGLFFTFIKYLIVMCIIRIITVDIFNLLTSLLGGDSCEQNCSHQFWSYASILYKSNREDLIILTDVLSLLATVFLIIYFLAYRKFQYLMYDIIDATNQTQDDFTIFVQNIPILNFPNTQRQALQFDYDADLDRYFTLCIQKWITNTDNETQWQEPQENSLEADYKAVLQMKGNQYQDIPQDIVKTITLCYDLSRLDRIRKIRNKYMEVYQSNNGEQPNINEEVYGMQGANKSVPEKVDFLNGVEIRMCQAYANANTNVDLSTTHFIGSAFISFKYQHYREHIVRKYQQNSQCFPFKDSFLKVSRACHPSEILWYNLKLEPSQRNRRTLLSFFILFVFLIMAFALLVLSNKFKDFLMGFIKQKGEQMNDAAFLTYGGICVSFITTIVTLVINKFLQIFSYGLTDWERHQTRSNQKLSLTIKLVVTQFINTVVIYYFISAFINQQQGNSLLRQEGLVFQISSLVVTSGLIQIAMNLINIPAMIRWAKLKWYFRDLGKDSTVQMFQVNLNKMYEYVEYDISQRYAYYILQLFTASFYSYLVPISAPAVAVILTIQYWIDKYNLFRRSSLFYRLNYSLSRNIVKIGQISLLIYTIGVVIFSANLQGYVHPFNIIAAIVAFIFITLSFFLPANVEHRLFRSYETCENLSYDECAEDGKFQKTYWDENPATYLVNEGKVSRRKAIDYHMQEISIADSDDAIGEDQLDQGALSIDNENMDKSFNNE